MTAIRRGGLADEIVAYVRARILSGEMRPGEKIDQEAIAEALDVSRSPIREALVILGQEGLVDVTPRRGAFVASISPEDVIDHYELFGLVSGRVAAMAATEFSPDDIDSLRVVHERFVAAGVDERTKLNDEFHALINAVAPRRTRWLLRHLARSIPAGFYAFTPGWDATACCDHERILDAIVAGDPDAARAAMEAHLHSAGAAAVDGLRARGFWQEAS